MTISFRPVDEAQDLTRLARWSNDPATKHLYHRFQRAEHLALEIPPEHFRPSAEGTTLMVLLDGAPVGHAVLCLGSPKLLEARETNAWIALMIGEPQRRGQGLGGATLAHLETLAVQQGATRAEVSVLAYNQGSLSFFQRHGYVEVTRIEARAWFDGRLWDEVRLRKPL